MIFTIVSQALVSLTIIIVLHYLYNFFKQNLTTPKVRDLVNKPNEEYKRIYTAINSGSNGKECSEEDKEKRKKELKNYMKSLTKKKEVSLQDNKSMGSSLNEGSLQSSTISSSEIQSFDLGSNAGYSTF